MKIAAGNPIERGRLVTEIKPKIYLDKLMAESFNGYVCVSTHGKYGIEEGTIIFSNGQIVSSDYEYYAFNKTFKAEEGLKRALNALYAKIGVIDSFSLSSYQVQLILTLNEETNIKTPLTKENITLPATFTFDYEEKLADEIPQEETPEEVFKKYGLTKYAAQESTRTQLVDRAKREHEGLDELLGENNEGE